MDWPYHFIDLSDAEKQQRRELLDTYARIAQFSVLVPLLVIQCAFALSWLTSSQQNQRDFEPPSSPHAKDSTLRRPNVLERCKSIARRVQWWLGEDQRLGDVEGTRGQILFALSWMLWLVWLSIAQTGKGEMQTSQPSMRECHV